MAFEHVGQHPHRARRVLQLGQRAGEIAAGARVVAEQRQRRAKLVGGRDAPGPLAGLGVDTISAALALERIAVEQIGGDIYLRGRTLR